MILRSDSLAFFNESFIPLNYPKNTTISNYLIPFLYSGDRDKFQITLKESGIGTNVSYRYPIYSMPAYQDLNYSASDFPMTEYFCESNISLPIFDYMPIELAYRVVEIVNKVLLN